MAVTDERPDPSSGPFDHEERAMKSSGEKATGTMTLFEHLAELRVRIVVVVLAVTIGTVIAWFFYDSAIGFMLRPYHEFLVHHKAKDISQGNLVTTGPLEGFTTRLKVSVYGGIALAAPVIFWELWRFITPGLYKNEKRYILPFVGAAVFLFAGGVATAILIFPKALTWLIDVSGTGVVPLFSPSRYFTLYVAMCLVFGLVFMLPPGGGVPSAGRGGSQLHLAPLAAAGHRGPGCGGRGDHPQQRPLLVPRPGRADAGASTRRRSSPAG